MSGEDDKRIAVDHVHPWQFTFPVSYILLKYAQGVDPDVLET